MEEEVGECCGDLGGDLVVQSARVLIVVVQGEEEEEDNEKDGVGKMGKRAVGARARWRGQHEGRMRKRRVASC